MFVFFIFTEFSENFVKKLLKYKEFSLKFFPFATNSFFCLFTALSVHATIKAFWLAFLL